MNECCDSKIVLWYHRTCHKCGTAFTVPAVVDVPPSEVFLVQLLDHLRQALLHMHTFLLIQVYRDLRKQKRGLYRLQSEVYYRARNHCQDGHRPLETAVRIGTLVRMEMSMEMIKTSEPP